MKSKITEPLFSFFRSPVKNTFPTDQLTIEQVHHLITGENYRSRTDELRKTTDSKQVKKLKSQSFDYVCFSGTFEKRSNDALLSYSGLLTLDLDDLNDVEKVVDQLSQDNLIDLRLLFRSPSGNGLKVIVQTNGKKEDHLSYFNAYSNYLKHYYQLVVDRSGKDIARACFLCHDSHAIIYSALSQALSFDFEKWTNYKEEKPKDNSFKNSKDIELLIHELESRAIDITAHYNDWCAIGFALASELGEPGREYFHKISQYYPGYSRRDCNNQYDKCLGSKGHGVTISTLFYLAKKHGVYLTQPMHEQKEIKTNSPSFPNTMFNDLPEFLQNITTVANSPEEKDLLLLGSVASISACFPKLYGVYDGRRVYSNLYLFITAQASAGKGRLSCCRQIVKPIHKEIRDESKVLKQQYELDLIEFNSSKYSNCGLERPNLPPEKMLFIPANSSSTGAYQLLGDSDGRGLIFETEGDTLAQAFKSDYGNYSDGFRKAFHHETISYYRRSDREYVDIENPCISTVLSGTPKQISSLIPSAENGLFSRFIFYCMDIKPVWKDVFNNSKANGLEEYFDNLGTIFYELYGQLKSQPEVQFELTTKQQARFNQFFSQIQNEYLATQDIDYIATIRRLGLIGFRLCMIFTALRIIETGEHSSLIVCDDRDFNNMITMIRVLVKHSAKVYSELQKDAPPKKRMDQKQRFLDALPKNFSRKKYLEVAERLTIHPKTAEGYITKFIQNGLIHRDKQNHYNNSRPKEAEDSQEVKD